MIAYETNNELMHYGVLGMKWGVRKARKRVASAGTGVNEYSTGKNYDKVYSKYKGSRKKKELDASYQRGFKQLVNDVNSGKYTKDQIRRKNSELNRRYYNDAINLVNEWSRKFNKATLKDVDYKNVEAGAEYLNRRGKQIFNIVL